MLQDHFLYFPETRNADDFIAAHPSLAAWPDRDDLRGLLREARGPARATVVVFHGNAGGASDRVWYADRLSRLGLRVILAEYPGYGPRPGPLGEEALTADAVRTVDLARQRFGGPLLVIGESLGAAVAAGVVARAPQAVDGLVLITPWDRLESVARHHYGFLPVHWLLHDRYDSAAQLAGWPGPILVAVAERDSIVPARFGRALFDGLHGRKRLVVLPGVDHNDWTEVVDDGWWNASVGFLLDAAP